MTSSLRLAIGLLALLCAALAGAAEVGFLVAAPDRGFMGNQEIRERFAPFGERHKAELLFVTDERTRDAAASALGRLAARGARHVVVLPLFVSAAERRYAVLEAALAGADMTLAWARPWGESYFAVEALADRLRAHPAQGRRLVLVGAGAADATSATRIGTELVRIGRLAAEGLGHHSVAAVVWPERGAEDEEVLRAAARAALRDAAGAQVVPLHLARRLDSMMAFANVIAREVPAGAELLDEQPLGEAALDWMEREANRALPWPADRVGVVVAAHGSDWHWNESMREGARALGARHPVEYAFSMADPPVVEGAIRRLERRGVRAIVVVRVFGLEDSFTATFRRLIGADVEDGDAPAPHAGHHHGHGPSAPPPRIHSRAVLLTAGGLDDHPLFARALLDRARALSVDPRRETVILTAHGTDDEARNAKWLETLESLAARMREAGGEGFRTIRVGTWREDWPDKRAAWVPRIRGWVEEAGRDGAAIVIPARTNATGPETRLLEGLEYRLGSGFAPHPLFAEWLAAQVEEAVAGHGMAWPVTRQ